MKIIRLSYLILFLVLVAVHGCAPSPSGDMLRRARSVVAASPDSAIAILDSVDRMPRLPESDRMRSRLLRVEAGDRKYVVATSDSVIKTLLEYYIDGNHDRQLHPTVLYYAGRTYSDLGRSADALRCFKQALALLGEGEDSDLESRIHSQMATLFTRHRMFRHALSHIQQQIQCEKDSRDSIQTLYSQLSLAFAFRGVGQLDSARLIYLRLEKDPLVARDSVLRVTLTSQLISYLMDNGQFEKADSLSDTLSPFDGNRHDVAIPNILNRVDEKRQAYGNVIGRSAELLHSNNIYVRRKAARNLALSHIREGNPEEGLRFLERYSGISDSIATMEGSSSLAEVEEMLNNAELEAVSEKLKNEEETNYYLAVVIILVLSVSILSIRLLSDRAKLKRSRMINDLQLEAEEKLREKELKIKDLETSYNLQREYISTLKGGIMRKSSEYGDDAARDVEYARIRLTQVSYHFLDEGRKAACGITDKDFMELESLLSVVHPRLMVWITESGLKQRDRRDAMLIKIDVSLKMCSNILRASSSALANSRTRLFRKLMEKGNIGEGFKSYSDFIMSL